MWEQDIMSHQNTTLREIRNDENKCFWWYKQVHIGYAPIWDKNKKSSQRNKLKVYFDDTDKFIRFEVNLYSLGQNILTFFTVQ